MSEPRYPQERDSEHLKRFENRLSNLSVQRAGELGEKCGPEPRFADGAADRREPLLRIVAPELADRRLLDLLTESREGRLERPLHPRPRLDERSINEERQDADVAEGCETFDDRNRGRL